MGRYRSRPGVAGPTGTKWESWSRGGTIGVPGGRDCEIKRRHILEFEGGLQELETRILDHNRYTRKMSHNSDNQYECRA